MEAKKINPVFDDLQNSETIINHVEQLQKDLEAEKEFLKSRNFSLGLVENFILS